MGAGEACEWRGRGCDGWRRTGVDSREPPHAKPITNMEGGIRNRVPATSAAPSTPWDPSERCIRGGPSRAVSGARGKEQSQTQRANTQLPLPEIVMADNFCQKQRKAEHAISGSRKSAAARGDVSPRTLFLREEDAVFSVRLRGPPWLLCSSGRRRVSAARRVRFPEPAECWRVARVPRRRRG